MEYLKSGAITNIPLYFAGKMFELVSSNTQPLRGDVRPPESGT
jgi:hypothetical protein